MSDDEDEAAASASSVPMETCIFIDVPEKAYKQSEKKLKANVTKPIVPECFHLRGTDANYINDADGNVFLTSSMVTYYEGCDEEVKAHYFEGICRFSSNRHMCIVNGCNTVHSSSANETSNIVKHIKRAHPEVTPLNWMKPEYINQKMKEWEQAKKTAASTSRLHSAVKAPIKTLAVFKQTSISETMRFSASVIREKVLCVLSLRTYPSHSHQMLV